MSGERANELLRKSLLELQQARAALRAAEDAASEPIAIVGMACRAPGGVIDPESYWQLLSAGRDAIAPFPERWSPQAIYDPDREALGKSYCSQAGALADVARFDAAFFGISPREAASMDPQQRMALEVSWEALEHAGLCPAALAESLTGVYLGAGRSDYGSEDPSLDALDGQRSVGVANSVLAGRIAYTLGLLGPAIAVDTACSSALVALHLACSALRQRECDLALAGGVMVMCTPALLVEYARLGASSPSGRSRAFSADADGAGWAEGCGVLVLKRLSDAARAGDRVLALIRGSAVNQDGRSQGLSAPSGPAQARMLRRALEVSRLRPQDIDAIEAHGTGTPLGDPIEAGALAEVFGPGRSAAQPLWLGSAKSNIGHSQAAAGVLGVIKMVLALAHERLPRTLHAERPSPHIAWQGSGLALLQEARAWPRSAERVRRAGISSFGISGTNAHLIVEEAPLAATAVPADSEPSFALPLLLSARDEPALRAQAGRWAAWLEARPDVSFRDLTCSAAVRRTHMAMRASIDAASGAQAVEALRALSETGAHARVSVRRAERRKRVAFVFSGQGGQWPAMGRALCAGSRVFRSQVEACDAALRAYTGWSVAALLCGEAAAPSLERIDVVQPALFTMGVALAALWRSLGVEPGALIGHSQGEIAAAVVAGALSLDDAARVIATRSQLQQRLSGSGAMAFVELPVAEVEHRLGEPRWSRLSVAVVNTCESTVVAGEPPVVDAWLSQLASEGIFCRRVASDVAGHTAHMDAILDELRARLSPIAARPPQLLLVSTVTGAAIAGPALDRDYWCRNVREPVRLDRALASLLREGFDTFVEIGPHPVLGLSLTASCGERGTVVGSLRRDEGGLGTVLANLGLLHAEGLAVDWAALAGRAHQLVELPTYAFQRKPYWLSLPRLGSSALPERTARDDGAEPAPPAQLDLAALRALAPDARAERLTALVGEELRAVLGLAAGSALALSARPLDLGLSSLMGVELAKRLKARSGLALAAARILQADSVADIVAQAMRALGAPGAEPLGAPAEPAARAWLVPLQRPERPRLRLLCFPYSGGSAAAFARWPGDLPAHVEAWAVELPGRGRRYGEPAARTMRDVLDGIGAALSELPPLPLMVFGHSLGAILAFELARLELRRGAEVAHLFASGAAAPPLFRFPHVARLSDAELLASVRALGLSGAEAMAQDPELARMALQILRDDLTLVADYGYRGEARLALPITAFSASADLIAPFAAVDAWREQLQDLGQFRHQQLAGGHDFLEKERPALLAAIAEVVARSTGPAAAPAPRPAPRLWEEQR